METTVQNERITFSRNEALKRAGITFPKPIKTGTTIAGIVYKVHVHVYIFGILVIYMRINMIYEYYCGIK